MAATYEQAYATLKSAWWDDDKINQKLSERWLTPWGQTWWQETWWQVDNSSPINLISEYKDSEWNTKTYDEEKAEQWNIDFNNLVPTEEDGEEVSWWFDPKYAWTISLIVQEALKNWVTLGKLWSWLKAWWNWILKWVKRTASKALSNIWAIAAWLASAYDTAQDRKKWVLKAEYLTWNEWAWAYWRDVLRNLYWYTDNLLFWALPNIDAVYNKWEDDWLYTSIHSNEAQKKQKEQLETNKKVKATDKQMKKYRKEIDSAQEKYWWNAATEANNQITRMLVKSWDVSQKAQNEIRAELIDKWFKIKEVKDENWNTTYTWAKWKQTLQDYLNS